MSVKAKAVEDIKKIGVMFSGLVELGKELGELVSLEEAMMECRLEHDKLSKLNAEAKLNLDSIVAQIAEQEVKLKENFDQHKKSLKLVNAEEKAKFEMECEALKLKSDELIADAESKLKVLQDKFNHESAYINAELNSLNVELAEKESKRKEINKVLASIKGGI